MPSQTTPSGSATIAVTECAGISTSERIAGLPEARRTATAGGRLFIQRFPSASSARRSISLGASRGSSGSSTSRPAVSSRRRMRLPRATTSRPSMRKGKAFSPPAIRRTRGGAAGQPAGISTSVRPSSPEPHQSAPSAPSTRFRTSRGAPATLPSKRHSPPSLRTAARPSSRPIHTRPGSAAERSREKTVHCSVPRTLRTVSPRSTKRPKAVPTRRSSPLGGRLQAVDRPGTARMRTGRPSPGSPETLVKTPAAVATHSAPRWRAT